MKLRPRILVLVAARWARRWSDRVLGAPEAVSTGPPAHWIDRIRKKRPELLRGLVKGGSLFRASRAGGVAGDRISSRPMFPHPHQVHDSPPSYAEDAMGRDDREPSEEPVRTTPIRSFPLRFRYGHRASERSIASLTWPGDAGSPRRAPTLTFSRADTLRSRSTAVPSWPEPPEPREQVWGRPDRSSGSTGSNPQWLAPPDHGPAPEPWWPPKPEPTKDREPAFPRIISDEETTSPRYPNLVKRSVPLPPSPKPSNRPPSEVEARYAHLSAAGDMRDAQISWPRGLVDPWPELPSEQRTEAPSHFDERDHRRKLDLEQRGVPWNVSPFS
jgi:hypothetical protein